MYCLKCIHDTVNVNTVNRKWGGGGGGGETA